MLKKVHIKIKKYIFRKHFQKKDKEIIKKCELYNKFLSLSQERSKLFTYDKAVKSYLEILK